MSCDLFNRYLSEHGQAISDISAIADKLPGDPNTLREPAVRCRAAELHAASSGKVLRLRQLAQQLDELALRTSNP
jgi:hypothetical protein